MNRRIAHDWFAGSGRDWLAVSQRYRAGRRGCPGARAGQEGDVLEGHFRGQCGLPARVDSPGVEEHVSAARRRSRMPSSARPLLAVEIDINHVDLAKMQMLIFQTGMYPGRRHAVEPRQPGNPPAAGGVLRKIRLSQRSPCPK